MFMSQTTTITVSRSSNANGNFLLKWGNQGSDEADGELWSPRGITVDASGNVYVADSRNNCVQKFDSVGTFLTQVW